jgi:hypothetical protein
MRAWAAPPLPGISRRHAAFSMSPKVGQRFVAVAEPGRDVSDLVQHLDLEQRIVAVEQLQTAGIERPRTLVVAHAASLVAGRDEAMAGPARIVTVLVEYGDVFELVDGHGLAGAGFDPLRGEALAPPGDLLIDRRFDQHALVHVGEAPGGLVTHETGIGSS